MAITFKIKRGTKQQNLAYTGQEGELTMQTDSGEESVRIHDGSTDGGFELGRADLKNVKIPLGGVTFEYFWHGTAISSGGSDTYPTDASLGTSDLAFGGTHYLYLDQEDRYNVDLSNFLDKISTVSATIIGQFRVYKKDDASKFKIFSITDSTKVTGGGHSGTHYRFEVEELASNLTLVDDDEIVISYVSAGEDAISVFLTKGNHSFLATSEGTVTDTLADGSTEVRLYVGATQAKFATTGGVDNTYTVGDPVISPAGAITLSASTVSDQRVFTPTAMAKAYDSAVVSFPITVYKADGSSIPLDRSVTYTKTKVSRNTILEVDDYQIGYDPAGLSADPSTFILTATNHGFESAYSQFDETAPIRDLVVSGGPNWAEGTKITSGTNSAVVYVRTDSNTFKITDLVGTLTGTITDGTNSGTRVSLGALSTHTKSVKAKNTTHTQSITSPTNRFLRRTYTSKVYEGETDTDILARDSISVFGTLGGTDSLTVIVTNENHAFQADENGSVHSFTGSGTFIEIYEGNDQLAFTDGTIADGKYTISKTDTGLTSGTLEVDDSGAVDRAKLNDATAMSADLANVNFTITVQRTDGRQTVLEKFQSLTRLMAGSTGKVFTVASDSQIYTFDKKELPTPTSQEIQITAFHDNLGKFSNKKKLKVLTLSASATWADGDTFTTTRSGTNTTTFEVYQGSGTSWYATPTGSNVFTATSFQANDVVDGKTINAVADSTAPKLTWSLSGKKDDGTNVATVSGLSRLADPNNTIANDNKRVLDVRNFVPDHAVDKVTILNAGTGYSSSTTSVNATGGTGTGLKVLVNITDDGVVKNVTVDPSNKGTGYVHGETVTISGGGGNATLTIGLDFLKTATVSVEAEFATDADGGTSTLDDTYTLYKLKEGKDAYTILLSNENHTFPVDSTGKVDDQQQAAGTCDVTVYEGITKLDVASAGSLTKGSWYIAQPTASNLNNMEIETLVFDYANDKISIKPKDGGDRLNIFADNASVDIDITVQSSDGESNTNFQRTITYSKATTAKAPVTVKLTSDDYQIAYDSANNKPTPSSVTLTAKATNLVKDAYYEITQTEDGTESDVATLAVGKIFDISETDGDTITESVTSKATRFIKRVFAVNVYDSYQNDVVTGFGSITGTNTGYKNGTNVSVTGGTGTGLTVNLTTNSSTGAITEVTVNNAGIDYVNGENVTITGGTAQIALVTGNPVIATDSITVIGTTDAKDAITTVLTNENHTFRAGENGNVTTYNGGSTDIEVYEGNVQVEYNATAISGRVYDFEVLAAGSGYSSGQTNISTENVDTSRTDDDLFTISLGSGQTTITATATVHTKGSGYKVGDIIDVGAGGGQVKITDTAGTWKIGDIIDTNITKSGSPTATNGAVKYVSGTPSAMVADFASITYPIVITRGNGETKTINRIQSFTKSIKGDVGILSQTVRLTGDHQTFVFASTKKPNDVPDETDNPDASTSTQEIQLTVNTQNLDGVPKTLVVHTQAGSEYSTGATEYAVSGGTGTGMHVTISAVDSSSNNALETVALVAGKEGSGYTANDIVSIPTAGDGGGQIKISAVDDAKIKWDTDGRTLTNTDPGDDFVSLYPSSGASGTPVTQNAYPALGSNSTKVVYVPMKEFTHGSGADSKFLKTATITATVTSGGETFSDDYTIYNVTEGSDAITAIISNEAHTFQSDANGKVDDSEASAGQSTIKVLQGARELTYVVPDGSGNPLNTTTKNGSYTIVQSGKTASIASVNADVTTQFDDMSVKGNANNTNIVTITPATSGGKVTMSADSASVPMTIKVRKFGEDTAIESLSRSLSYTKSRLGSDATDISLSAEALVYTEKKDTTGSNDAVTPEWIAITPKIISTTDEAAASSSKTRVQWSTTSEDQTGTALTGSSTGIGLAFGTSQPTGTISYYTGDGTTHTTDYKSGGNVIKAWAHRDKFTESSNISAGNYRASAVITAKQIDDGVVTGTPSISTAGSGYRVKSDVETSEVSGTGNGTGLTVNITAVNSSGAITGITVNQGGAGYDDGDVLKIHGSNISGGDAQITLDSGDTSDNQEKASSQIALTKLIEGEDGMEIQLTTPTFTIKAGDDNVVQTSELTGTATELTVRQGPTYLEPKNKYTTVAGTTTTTLTAGQYYLDTLTITASHGLKVGTALDPHVSANNTQNLNIVSSFQDRDTSVTGNDSIVMRDFSAISNTINTVKVEFNLKICDLKGVVSTRKVAQVLTKAGKGFNTPVVRLTKDPIAIATTNDGAKRPNGTALGTIGTGEMKTYYGGIEITSDVTYKVKQANGSFGATRTISGLQLAIVEASGVYTLTENSAWTSDTEEFILRATISGAKAKTLGLNDDSSAVNLDMVLDVAKAKMGLGTVGGHLTNANVSIPTNAAGTLAPGGGTTAIDLTSAVGQFKVVIDGVEVQDNASVTFAVKQSDDDYDVDNRTISGLKFDFTDTDGNYILEENGGWASSSSSVDFIVRAIIAGSYAESQGISSDGSAVNVDLTYTISKAREGQAPFEVTLTNDPVSIPTNSNGDKAPDGTSALDYTNAGGKFNVIVAGFGTDGVVNTDSNVSYSLDGTTYATSGDLTSTDNNLTITLNAATGAYTLSGATWNTDSEEFTLYAKIAGSQANIWGLSNDGSDVLAQKIYTITKSKKGESTVEGLLTNDPVTVVTGPEGTKSLNGGHIDYNVAGGDFRVLVNGVNQSSHADVTFTGTTTSDSQLTITINGASGAYSLANENNTNKIWNSDTEEFTLTASITNAQAKLWGLTTGSSAITIDKKFTISKNKVGARVDLRLTRDPVIVSTNRKGNYKIDGSTPIDFTETGESYSGKAEISIRGDSGEITLVPSSVVKFAVNTNNDNLKLLFTTSGGANGVADTNYVAGNNGKQYYLISHTGTNNWTTTVDHTEFIITATIKATEAQKYGLGSADFSVSKVLDVTRAREGAKTYEAKLTNDGVVMPTDVTGTTQFDGVAFNGGGDTWKDSADGAMNVYFAGSVDDDSNGITYTIVGGSTDGDYHVSADKNGLKLQIHQTNGGYGLNTYNSWTSDAEEFTIRATIPNSFAITKSIVDSDYSGAEGSVYIDKVFTISKGKQGASTVHGRLTNDTTVITTNRAGTLQPDGTALAFKSAYVEQGTMTVVAGETTISTTNDVHFKITDDAQNETTATGNPIEHTIDGLSLQIDDDGVYKIKEDSAWNQDETEFQLNAIVGNTTAKKYGLVAQSSSDTVTVSAKFTISKAKQGASVAVGRLTNDSTIVSTNPYGDRDPDGTTFDFRGSYASQGQMIATVGDVIVSLETDTHFKIKTAATPTYTSLTSSTEDPKPLIGEPTGNSPVNHVQNDLRIEIWDNGIYRIKEDNGSGDTWNTDKEEFELICVIGNVTAKKYGLVAETSSETVSVSSKFTIAKSKKGIGNAVAYLTNPKSTVATNEDGTGMDGSESGANDLTYGGSGGFMLVTVGKTDLRTQSDVQFAVGSGSFGATASGSSSGLTVSIDTSGVYSFSGGSWSSSFTSFTLKAKILNQLARQYGLVDNTSDTVIVEASVAVTKAPRGVSGVTGLSGVTGQSGITGTSGKTGTSGASGITGKSGITGTSGASGITGTSGQVGTSGQTGSSGQVGTSGQTGSSGQSGASGQTGSSGQSGASGQTGSSGEGGGTSDERLKSNISGWTGTLEKLRKLAPSAFNWDLGHDAIEGGLPEYHGKQLGVIAQQIEQIYPELVYDGVDGYKKVRGLALISVLLSGLHTLDNEIQNLYDILGKPRNV